MTRLSLFNSPLMLGFEDFERTLDRIAKAGQDGYPPYNIERTGEDRLRITLAVAGFPLTALTIRVEDNQLIVRGKQEEDTDRVFLHRGIAARQFQKAFVLADGIEVLGASLDNGLLHIDLVRPTPAVKVRTVEISRPDGAGRGRTAAVDVAEGSAGEEQAGVSAKNGQK